MSEASSSFQIKTDDPSGCIAKLRANGFKGIAFRGGSGWLTVVPYPSCEDPIAQGCSAESLAASLGMPILAYSCHEDFGWGFSLVLPNGRWTSFACFADPSGDDWANPELGGNFHPDEGLLAEVLDVERIRTFLQPPPADPGEGGPDYGFAQTLGFPAYRWLSPDQLRDDREGALKRGGEEIGQPPPHQA